MKIKYWFLLSRVPFLSVLVAPYILGSLLAGRACGIFNLPVFIFGLSGAVLVQLVAHYSGEVHDLAEDRLSVVLEKNFFSGGSGVLVENRLVPKNVIILNRSFLFLAVAVGLILQGYFRTGSLTLWLGMTGIFCAYFYSTPPLRLVSRGIGELLIAYAFGWLSVNAGFYLQAGRFAMLGTWISIPVACSVANIILINEFPDYLADKQCLKKNMLVRIGKENGSRVYAALAVTGALAFIFSLAKGVPLQTGIFYLPVLFLSLGLAYRMLKGGYRERVALEKMCGLTILVNLGTTLSYLLGLLFRYKF